MKTTSLFRTIALSAALPLSIAAQTLPAFAQNTPKAPGGKAPARAIKHAEDVLGKPLTPAQKTAVKAAQKQRLLAMKPIQDKYKATVAKALGLTVAQYEAREKALHPKKN